MVCLGAPFSVNKDRNNFWQVHFISLLHILLGALLLSSIWKTKHTQRKKHIFVSQRVLYFRYLYLPHVDGYLLLCHFVVCTIDLKLAGHDS